MYHNEENDCAWSPLSLPGDRGLAEQRRGNRGPQAAKNDCSWYRFMARIAIELWPLAWLGLLRTIGPGLCEGEMCGIVGNNDR